MSYGSCLAIFTNTGCSNPNGYLTNTYDCYRATIYGARTCILRDVDVRCSSGTLLKAVGVSSDGVSGGLSIHCYRPAAAVFSGPAETHNLNSTATIKNPISSSCEGGIGGLVNQVDGVRDVVISTSAVCENQCPQGEAVVGITAKIEEFSKLK